MKRLVALLMLLPMLSWAPTQLLQRKSPSFVIGSSSSYFGGLVSTTDLVAYWRMDESSDGSGAVTRNDSWATNNLTDNNTTASAAGIITNAADIETSNTEYLSIADNENVSMQAGTSYTITGWLRPETAPTTGPLICKASASGIGTEYMIWGNGNTDFRARTGDGTVFATVTNAVAPLNNTWYFIAFRCDLDNDLLKLSINLTNATVAYTGSTTNTASAMEVGRLPYSTSNRADGRVDEIGIWKRVLTDDEITALYNSGAGRTL